MTPAHSTTPAGKHLALPMTTLFSVKKSNGRTIAHALDFDLVATGSNSDEALSKLREAVKRHVEFGFRHNLGQDQILLKAPDECWAKIKNATLALGEEIEIDNQRIRTLTQTAIDEDQASLTAVN